MKRILLSLAMGVMMPLAAAAQWTTDTGNGINLWPYDFTNYGYSVVTNQQGYSYVFAHGVYSETNTSDQTISHYPMYVQIVRPDGTKVFENEGYELCEEPNLSWTMINQDLALANDGSVIISVCDLRVGPGLSYTIYRMDQEGKLLWNGTTLNGSYAPRNLADQNIVPTADDGAVFAYEYFGSDDGTVPTMVKMEKLDKNGASVWRDSISTKEDNTYPYLVDAGDNQTLLVWAQGANQNLKCRLLDFDGTSAWGEDITVYSGGFSANPLWTMVKTAKAKDGILVAWQDADPNTGSYENRISYVLRDDGSFNFSDGDAGTIISNDATVSRMVPDMYYDNDEDAIYCAYYVFNQTYQNLQGIYAQKLSSEGELLWDSEGVAVEPVRVKPGEEINTDSLVYLSAPAIRSMGNGNEAVFYLKQNAPFDYYGRVDAYMAVLDGDGEPVGDTKMILPNDAATKSSLQVSELIGGTHYVIVWKETIPVDTDETGKTVYGTNVQAARVNLNGTTDKISETDQEVVKKLVSRQTYTLDGKRMEATQKGLSIVKETYSDGSSVTRKQLR